MIDGIAPHAPAIQRSLMIRVCDLAKRFPSGTRDVVAVDHLSFAVGAGEVYGLLGPNGAGKTTSLRIIVGLMPADEGFAEIDGLRSDQHPEDVKGRIGLVSVNDGVYPWLTAREMLLFFADLYGMSPSAAHDSLDRLRQLLGLDDYLDRRCAVLSTGQRQRIILARGLMHDPPAMFLDEPTRGLDVLGVQVVMKYLSHLRAEGKAVVLCTHRLDEAQRLCDRFGLLHRGRLLHEGTLSELQASTGCSSLVEIFERELAAPQ